jgi:uncharacterized membrane protein
MDKTHLHLLINHLPSIGSILGAFVLAHALWTRNTQTKLAAYCLLLISAIGGVIAYLTGEAAEESVEHIEGVSHDLIEQHEDFAKMALIAMIALGVIALPGIYTALKRHALARKVAGLTFIAAIIGFILTARTGYTGGQIRHSEIRGENIVDTHGEEDEHEEEHDND